MFFYMYIRQNTCCQLYTRSQHVWECESKKLQFWNFTIVASKFTTSCTVSSTQHNSVACRQTRVIDKHDRTI